MDCKFCKDYFDFLEENNELRKQFKFRYKACLVEEVIKDGQVRSTVTWKKRPLNYCPSCGDKLVAL